MTSFFRRCATQPPVIPAKEFQDTHFFETRQALGKRVESALAVVHVLVYVLTVKRRELEQRLRALGWRFLRHGGSHDVWTDGQDQTPIPRHTEINEGTARGILRYAQQCVATREKD